MLTGRLGPYTLIRQIAVGGMAEIYLAVPEGSEPPQYLAIKVIHQQNADDPDFVRMLVDEARLAVLLKHPNIVTTYDLGLENDQYYIVMELVEGADLFRLQQRAADQRLSFPIPLAAYIAREVARGLDYAHRLRDADGQPLQVVHRDISPQNVLLAYDGSVKITDFGIAKAARRAAQTQAGIIKGKYYYMSPEQASGQFIDGRTDTFAAGILLYEMLIGEMLYYDDNVERLLQAVRKADIPPVSHRRPDTPPALERALMKALAKSPSDRYQTAGEYGQALDNYLRRYAPRTGAADVGAFLEKLVGERAHRRTLNESTAALNVPGAAFTAGSHDDRGDETVGLSSAQIRQLEIADDNSLIFQSKVHAVSRRTSGSSPSGRGSAGSAGAAGDDGLVKTTQRTMDRLPARAAGRAEDRAPKPPGKQSAKPQGPRPGQRSEAVPGDSPKLVRRGLSSGTMEVVVPSLRPGGGPASGTSPAEPSDEVPADNVPESGGAARPPGSRVPFSLSSKPAEVFRAIEQEMEEELLAAAAELAPQPYAITGPRRTPVSVPRHEPLAAQLSNGEVTVPRAEVPPELLAALMPQPEDRRPVRPPPPPPPPPGPAPREPMSGDQSSKVELLQSDLAFSDSALLPVGPNVELAQSDTSFSDPQLAPVHANQHPYESGDGHTSSDGPPAAYSDPSLDPISAESTHSHLKPAPHRPEPEPEPPPPPPSEPFLPVQPMEPSAPVPARLWPYWVSGLSAALLSAGLTWYVTGPGSHRSNVGAPAGDLAPAGNPPPVLFVPDAPIPDIEPAPAGETLPAPSSPPTAEPTSAGSTSDESGELELSSTPDGAEVYVNKKLAGHTPLTLHDLATDKTLKVELRLDGYKPLQKRIKWRGKTHLELSVSLQSEGDDGGSSGIKSGADGSVDKDKADSSAKP